VSVQGGSCERAKRRGPRVMGLRLCKGGGHARGSCKGVRQGVDLQGLSVQGLSVQGGLVRACRAGSPMQWDHGHARAECARNERARGSCKGLMEGVSMHGGEGKC